MNLQNTFLHINNFLVKNNRRKKRKLKKFLKKEEKMIKEIFKNDLQDKRLILKMVRLLDTKVFSKHDFFDVKDLSSEKMTELNKILFDEFCIPENMQLKAARYNIFIKCINDHNKNLYQFLCEEGDLQTILYMGIKKYQILNEDIPALSENITRWYDEMKSESTYLKLTHLNYYVEKCIENMNVRWNELKNMAIRCARGIVVMIFLLDATILLKHQYHCWWFEECIVLEMVVTVGFLIKLIIDVIALMGQKLKIDELVGKMYNDYYSLYISCLQEYISTKKNNII